MFTYKYYTIRSRSLNNTSFFLMSVCLSAAAAVILVYALPWQKPTFGTCYVFSFFPSSRLVGDRSCVSIYQVCPLKGNFLIGNCFCVVGNGKRVFISKSACMQRYIIIAEE